MYAGLTGITLLLLFAVIFWSTARFMRHQIDDSVANELSEILTDGQALDPPGFIQLVQGMARHPSGFFYLFEDAGGAVLAGNLPATSPQIGVREWPGQGNRRSGTAFSGLRGRGVAVSGNYLFVGWSTHQLHEMEEFVAVAFLWVLAASTLLALAGGIVMSNRLIVKVENVGRTTRNIIERDLKQRVPVQRANDEFDHLAVSINAMLDRIETLMDDLRQVTTDIAHDLRTPLSRLRNRLELAQETPLGEAELRDILGAARRETDVILEIFGALLRIAQVESGARRAGFANVSLSDVLDTVIEVYRPTVDERQQTLDETVARPLLVFGDKELLVQMFANLLQNAILHSPPGARLAVHAAADPHGVQVVISDDGPGIPESMRTKVLGRFVRLENSRTTSGSGLGLSMVAAIAQLHGAALLLSDNDPGLRIRVSFARPGAPTADVTAGRSSRRDDTSI